MEMQLLFNAWLAVTEINFHDIFMQSNRKSVSGEAEVKAG